MMTFFPVPYEDEVLYSVLARYHVRSGNISYKATMRDLFGSTSVTAVIYITSSIICPLIPGIPKNILLKIIHFFRSILLSCLLSVQNKFFNQ